MLSRQDDGYELARRATVWNGRVPERYPDVVVQVETVAEVISAVQYANDHDLVIGVCSGGR